MMRSGWVMLALASLAAVSPVAAQRPARGNVPSPPESRLGENAQGRQALQRQVRQRFWALTRDRVGLSNDQMRKLAPVNQRFEKERHGILREERETRTALRRALLDSSKLDQRAIADHLDRMMQLQHQRLDLVEREQKELAQFMSPSQRARYMALQEQMRRRVEQIRRRPPAAPDSR
ncbi:MAG TPA: hypothetical protein VJU87_06115 [Gemmatimonadaceae bacterium]|nr:hypothetical protein [Gemmatimonadaceae bacterium]